MSPFTGTNLLEGLITKTHISGKQLSTEEYYAKGILPQMYLTKTDRMSMANSLEVRAPLLGSGVVEEAFKVSHIQLLFTERKRILRQLSSKYLPKYVTERPKHGFSLPSSRLIPFLSEPNWTNRVTEIWEEKPSEVWRKAHQSQNLSNPAWALYV